MVVDPLILSSLIGAGTGGLSYLNDLEKAKQNRKILAESIRVSPWTGMKPDPMSVQDPNLMGSLVKGGLSGAAFGAKNFDLLGGTPEVDTELVGEGSPDEPSALSPQGYEMSPKVDPNKFNPDLGPGGKSSLYQSSQGMNFSPWEKLAVLQQLKQGGGSWG